MFLRRPRYVFVPSGPGPVVGWPEAQYFRINNFAFVGSNPQIVNIAFQDGGADLVPTSIITAAGNQTAVLTNTTITFNISTWSYFDFDFGADVAPDLLRITYFESDIDYIDSADIYVSHDDITYTQIGSFRKEDTYSRYGVFDASYFYFDIGVEEGVSNQLTTYATAGAREGGIAVQAFDTKIVIGGINEGVSLQAFDTYVVTKPI